MMKGHDMRWDLNSGLSPSLSFASPLPQVSNLVDLKTFLQNPLHNPKGLTFKTQNDRRRHIKEKMGLKIIRNPKDQSECVAVYDRTLMLSGQRSSASRIKEEEYSHGEKDAAKESFSKAQGGLMQPQRHTRVQDLVLVCGKRKISSIVSDQIISPSESALEFQ